MKSFLDCVATKFSAIAVGHQETVSLAVEDFKTAACPAGITGQLSQKEPSDRVFGPIDGRGALLSNCATNHPSVPQLQLVNMGDRDWDSWIANR